MKQWTQARVAGLCGIQGGDTVIDINGEQFVFIYRDSA